MTLKTLLAALAIAALAAGWMLRFDLEIAAGGQGTAPAGYVLDRWTGAVHYVAPSMRRELRPERRLIDLDVK